MAPEKLTALEVQLRDALKAAFHDMATKDPLYLDTQWPSVPGIRDALAAAQEKEQGK